MTLEQYSKEAARTCPELGGQLLDSIHMVLGMNTELLEYRQATDAINQAEELSDFFWYLSNLCRINNIKINNTFEFGTLAPRLEDTVAELQDLYKKAFAYSKPIDEIRLKYYCDTAFITMCNLFIESDIDTVTPKEEDLLFYWLDKNIQKLRLRFPDKFDKDLAINRNHDKEREVLES